VPLSRTVAPYAGHNHHNQRRAADGTGDTDTFIPVTNLIESMNARLRKVTRKCQRHAKFDQLSARPRPGQFSRAVDSKRGRFPNEQAALKVLYLAVRNPDELRSPSVGTSSSGWKKALQAFTIYFEGRIPTP
jgi:transposase-like protein